MSYSPKSIDDLLDFFRPYMSCSECKHSSIEVVENSCCHQLCERCSQTHKCNEPTVQSLQSPSWAFMKDLYQQLNKISQSSKSFSTLSSEKDLTMPKKCTKRPHSNKLTNGHVESNKFIPKSKFIPTNGKKNNENSKLLEFHLADPEVIVTRYKTNGQESNNEMPILVREDNQEKNCLNETCNSDKLDKCNGTFNSTYDDVEIVEPKISQVSIVDSSYDENVATATKRRKHESISGCTLIKKNSQEFENRSDSSLSSDENCLIINEGSSSMDVVPTESLPGPSGIKAMKDSTTGKFVAKLNLPQEYDFGGFRENDINCSLIIYLQFKRFINNSSSEEGTAGNSKVVLSYTDEDIYNQITFSASVTPSPKKVPCTGSPVHNNEVETETSSKAPAEKEGQIICHPSGEGCSSGNLPPIEKKVEQPSPTITKRIIKRSKRKKKKFPHNECNVCCPQSEKAKPKAKKNAVYHRRRQLARMLKALNQIISEEQNEELKIEINEKNNDSLRLFSWGLTCHQQMSMAQFARLTNAKLNNCLSRETTHFIMGENALESQEYLLAIAYGVKIVTFDWIVSCLDQKKIVDPMNFILQTELGPSRCLAGDMKPFEGFYFFLGISPLRSHLDYDSYQVTKTLCYHGGARIILDHDKFFPYVKIRKVNPRFFISINSVLTDDVKETCVKLKAVPIMHTWIFSCIRQYRPIPIFEFMYSPLSPHYDNIDLSQVPIDILGST